MKTFISISLLTLLAFGQAFCQVPAAFNYQAIARDASGNAIANTNITVRLTIEQGSNPGTPEYTETQSATTNQFGLFVLGIGRGTVVYGSFAGVNWGTANTYILVEFDPNGGSNYQSMGVTQLLSVPYALNAGSLLGNDSLPVSVAWSVNGNNNATGTSFIGTTTNQILQFRINNQKAGVIDNAYNNTGLGFQALNANDSSSNNTAFGVSSMYSNTLGYSNVAAGIATLYSNVDRSNLVAIGDSALFSNGLGVIKPAQAIQNTAVGSKSMLSNALGSANTALGFWALSANTIGDNNTSLGAYSLLSNTTGASNTAIGLNSLTANVDGDYNTAIGYGAFVTGSSYTNSTAIGYNTSVDSSNEVRVGNTSVTSIGGQVGWTTYSDARVKNDIQENVPGLTFINALRPVTYHYDVNKEEQLMGRKGSTDWNGKYNIEELSFSGFIAQEVDATAKQIGYDFNGVDKGGKIWGIRYAEFVPSIVKGMQEQQLLIERQNENILNQQRQIDELTKQLENLKSLL